MTAYGCSTCWTQPTREKRGEANFRLTYTRDKASVDIFWRRDDSLEESDNLPDPNVRAYLDAQHK